MGFSELFPKTRHVFVQGKLKDSGKGFFFYWICSIYLGGCVETFGERVFLLGWSIYLGCVFSEKVSFYWVGQSIWDVSFWRRCLSTGLVNLSGMCLFGEGIFLLGWSIYLGCVFLEVSFYWVGQSIWDVSFWRRCLSTGLVNLSGMCLFGERVFLLGWSIYLGCV